MTSVLRNSPDDVTTSTNLVARTPGMAFEPGRTVVFSGSTTTTTPILITQVGTWVAGNGGSRNITLTLGTSSVNIPFTSASTLAEDTGLLNLTSPLLVSNTASTATGTGRFDFTISVSPQGAGNDFFFGRLTTATSGSSASQPGTSPVLGTGLAVNPSGKLAIRYTYLRAPLAPTVSVVSPNTFGSVSGRASVSWTTPDNGGSSITGYRVQWSTSSTFASSVNTLNVGASTNSTNIDNLIPGTTYYFRVTARNAVTEAASAFGGAYSNTAQVTVSGLPSAPRTVTATPNSSVLGRVDLAWTAPLTIAGGITAYVIYVDGTQFGTVSGSTLSFAATGLTQRQVFSFSVAAVNTFASNNSTTGPLSSPVTAKSPGVPTPPRNLSGFSVENSVQLSWDLPLDVGAGPITGYDVYKANFTPITATGGDITTVTRSGVQWRVHSFLSGTQNFSVSDAGSDGDIRYLVVGGGGSGGRASASASGGGGAGGFVEGVAVVSSGTYSVAVGNGGATKTTTGVGNSGEPSSISGITGASAPGGGGGGFEGGAGASGGSGGGGGGGSASATGTAGGAGTLGVGRAGGTGFNSSTSSQRAGGGGGGAGANGANASSSTGGVGGNGLSSDIRTGTAAFYAGGGGGGHNNTTVAARAGGTGGGGGGGRTSTAGTAGQTNTGGGGGGSGTGNGGAGGSGIVVITYPLTPPLLSRQGTSRTYTHTGRVFGETYSYTVRARNAIADTNSTASDDSNVFSVTVLITGPQNFQVNAATTTSGRLVLSWTAPLTATGYKIFDGNDVLLQDLGTVTSYAIDNLTPGVTYTYKIKATSEVQPEGGYFSGPVSGTPNPGSVQTVPNVQVINDTNERFSGTFAIIRVTSSTLEYASENPSYPDNSVPLNFGEIDNITNQSLVGNATISSAALDTLSFTKEGADIAPNTSVADGTLANLTNIPLVGDFTALVGTSGSSIVYSVDSPDLEATVADGTVTSSTTPEYNLSGVEVTSVTDRTVSYAVPGVPEAETSAAAGVITNKTNREVFNGENIEIDLVTGYNSFTYSIEGSGGLLDEDHSSTVEFPIDSMKKASSEAELKVKYRSGWLA
jgi:hypothetical protein